MSTFGRSQRKGKGAAEAVGGGALGTALPDALAQPLGWGELDACEL